MNGKVLVAFGKGTLQLHELIFRGYANIPGVSNARQRLLDIATKYHRLAVDQPLSMIETIEGEALSLETINGLMRRVDHPPEDFQPTWFTVERYVLKNGKREEIRDGFPDKFKSASLWELHIALERYKMTIPLGAWGWLAAASIGDTVTFAKRLEKGLYELTVIDLVERME